VLNDCNVVRGTADGSQQHAFYDTEGTTLFHVGDMTVTEQRSETPVEFRLVVRVADVVTLHCVRPTEDGLLDCTFVNSVILVSGLQRAAFVAVPKDGTISFISDGIKSATLRKFPLFCWSEVHINSSLTITKGGCDCTGKGAFICSVPFVTVLFLNSMIIQCIATADGQGSPRKRAYKRKEDTPVSSDESYRGTFSASMYPEHINRRQVLAKC
jgi:hypothetical protein